MTPLKDGVLPLTYKINIKMNNIHHHHYKISFWIGLILNILVLSGIFFVPAIFSMTFYAHIAWASNLVEIAMIPFMIINYLRNKKKNKEEYNEVFTEEPLVEEKLPSYEPIEKLFQDHEDHKIESDARRAGLNMFEQWLKGQNVSPYVKKWYEDHGIKEFPVIIVAPMCRATILNYYPYESKYSSTDYSNMMNEEFQKLKKDYQNKFILKNVKVDDLVLNKTIGKVVKVVYVEHQSHGNVLQDDTTDFGDYNTYTPAKNKQELIDFKKQYDATHK